MVKSMILVFSIDGRSSPEVECWISDHWVTGSNPLHLIVP